MGDRTGIAWTDATWNPIRGCRRVSEGCRNCYAERVASRFNGPGMPYEGLARAGRWTGVVRMVPEHLDDPLRWRKPRRIFVNSMSDLFHESLSDMQIDDVFAVMALSKQHAFQVLTKRPERMREWSKRCRGTKQFRGFDVAWPLPNVWLGVSAEDQATADARIPILLDTPAAVRFVSAEPLLGPIDLTRIRWPDEPHAQSHDALSGYSSDTPFALAKQGLPDCASRGRLDWVIVGGESGPGARPCDVAWIRSIVAQCRDAAVPCFVKQLGARTINSGDVGPWPVAPNDAIEWNDRKGGDPKEWPDDVRVQQFPIAALAPSDSSADARASSIPGAASETVIHRQSSEGAQPPGSSSAGSRDSAPSADASAPGSECPVATRSAGDSFDPTSESAHEMRDADRGGSDAAAGY